MTAENGVWILGTVVFVMTFVVLFYRDEKQMYKEWYETQWKRNEELFSQLCESRGKCAALEAMNQRKTQTKKGRSK